MTIKLAVIILVLLGGLYSIALKIIQARSANNPTPESVADVYDAETYQKWKKYSAENSRLGILSSAVSCVVALALIITDAYAAFASLFGEGFFPQLLSVALLEVIVSLITGIFFSYYRIMVIEERYGFNRSSIKTFIFDVIRGLVVELILLLALMTLLAVIHRAMGDWMIILFAGAVFCITLVISFLYPVFSRIGNKFTPLEEGELKDRLMELLTKHGYKVKAIEVMDASRRTTKLNAYFTGFGKMKTIVLYDNLLEAMSPDEICAVFAHELGHGLNKDVLKSQILNVANLLVMSLAAWLVLKEPSIYSQFGFEGINYGFAYILIGALLEVINPLTSLITNARSRAAEYRADRQAVKEGYGEAMITAFKKLAKENFSHLAPSKINVVLEYSHPPLAQRVDAVRKAMSEENK